MVSTFLGCLPRRTIKFAVKIMTANSVSSSTKPPRLQQRRSLLEFLRHGGANIVGNWYDTAYDKPFISSRRLMRRFCVANDPHSVRQILVSNADNYRKSAVMRGLLAPSLGEGLILSEGKDWQRRRRAISPAFHPQKIRGYTGAMLAETHVMLDRWGRWPVGKPLDIFAEMTRLALAIVCRTLFSLDREHIVSQLRETLGRCYHAKERIPIADLLGFPRWMPRRGLGKAKVAAADLDRILFAFIGERRDAGIGEDLLSMLLDWREEGGFPDRQIRNELATFLVAGHETTAVTMAWTFYLLATHPDAETRLCSELARELKGQEFEAADFPRLSYLRAVIDESLRLYPPAHTILREPIADDQVCGHEVRTGAIVLVVPWLLHRHRRYWTRPDAFEPERFLDRREDKKFVYIPFGIGPRGCIGASFAIMEAMAVVATVSTRYKLRLASDVPVEPVGLITLKPGNSLPMYLEAREHSSL